MKKKIFIAACFICYIAASVAIYYAVDDHIDKKVVRLHNAAIANLRLFFEDKPMYVDLLYGPYGCDYKEIPIPSPQEPTFYAVQGYITFIDSTLTYSEATNIVRQNMKDKWQKQYGNYRKLYELDIAPSEEDKYGRSGWALKIINIQRGEFLNDYIETFLVFPKQVAYKKIEPILYGSVPSVETTIQEAFDFTTKNEKSNLQFYYEKGSTYNLISKMESVVNNEYFHLIEDPENTHFYSSLDDFFGYKHPSSFEYGGMHNGYYEVVYYRTQPITYSIERVEDNVVQADKYRLAAIYIGLLTLIMLGIVIFIVKKK